MRKRLFLLTLLTAFAEALCAQPEQLPVSVLKMAPQQFAASALKVGIERFASSHERSLSLYLTGTLNGRNNQFYYENAIRGLGGELQYRKYLRSLQLITSKKNRNFLLGVYAMAFIQGSAFTQRIRNQTYHYDPVTETYDLVVEYDFEKKIGNWGGGVGLGLQRTFWEAFYVDVFVGGGLQWANVIHAGQLPPDFYFFSGRGIFDREYQGILPKVGLHLGIKL